MASQEKISRLKSLKNSFPRPTRPGFRILITVTVAILAEILGVDEVIPLDAVGEFGFESVERDMLPDKKALSIWIYSEFTVNLQ